MSNRSNRYVQMNEERSVGTADRSVRSIPNSVGGYSRSTSRRSLSYRSEQRDQYSSSSSGPPSVVSGGTGRDQEAPSIFADEQPLMDDGIVKEGERVDGEDAKKGIWSKLMTRSNLITLLFILIVLGAVVGGYYLARVDKVNEIMKNSDVNDDENCLYSQEDIEALNQEIKSLEAALAAANDDDCEFTLEDVAALQQEIANLEAANDQLADQLEDYQDITNQLNASIQELQIQNEILEANNDEYERLNAQLNASLAELGEHAAFLAEQLDIYEGLNQDLNATAIHLEEQVDRLEEEVDDLTFQNDRLEGLVGALTNQTEDLSELTDMLEANVDRLEDRIEVLSAENDRLEGLVDDFQTVADFLEETAGSLGETYNDVAAALAGQITTNKLLVVESLQNTYHQRVSNWDCALHDRFALEDFANDSTMSIPNDKLPAVMAYVEERVLSDLCLDANDFEQYMEERYNGEAITTSRLTTSVSRYTWDALDYYFPDQIDEDGLTSDDWATALYDCGNLQPEKQYFHIAS